MRAPSTLPRLPGAWRLLHLGVVGLLLFQCAYSVFQFFVVMQPPGTRGLLLGSAAEIDPAFLLARRLYAVEAWLAFGILVLYLALTEILPRRWPRP